MKFRYTLFVACIPYKLMHDISLKAAFSQRIPFMDVCSIEVAFDHCIFFWIVINAILNVKFVLHLYTCFNTALARHVFVYK